MNTPTTLAQKYWITNGAVHAKHVVVFAQLHVGGRNEGIHGVLVRIRDDDLKTMPQVKFDGFFIFGDFVPSKLTIFFVPGDSRGHGLQDGAERGGQRQAGIPQRQGAQGEPAQQGLTNKYEG